MSIDPTSVLTARFREAMIRALGDAAGEDPDPQIRPTQARQFGDFQSNAAMGLAKAMKKNPREVAQAIIAALDIADLCDPPDIAGPGFINLRFRPDALAAMLADLDSDALGLVPIEGEHVVVVDLVGVNVAKQMHVGHLRNSIIGDALVRVLSRFGYHVIPQNHLGDWGLQIAMVLTALREQRVDLGAITIEDLEDAYRDANLACKADERALATARRLNAGPHRIAECEEQVEGAREALERAKRTLVLLQSGDPEIVADWNRITRVTLDACYAVCRTLGLGVTAVHERGESFYRERLRAVVDDLLAAGIAEEDAGAIIVRFPDEESPMIIRKSDGGFLYATTDLAAVRYRVQDLHAERVIYVVDARQREHFRKVFSAVRMAGWDRLPGTGQAADLQHVAFGAVCGPDGRPLKTRSGENVRLMDLLEEAVRRAAVIVEEKNPGLSEEEKLEVATAVGIGGVKYADLSTHISRDYVFDWDRMLAFEGNTGAYLQNQYVRIRSIGRKAPEDVDAQAAFHIEAPAEKDLALNLLRYPTVVRQVAEALEPHRMCQYLYDLAQTFSVFYEQCPVLKPESPELRDPRLRLCNLTARVLADGLHLLGIRTLERM